MTVQNLYTQYLDGKVTKSKFLYEVRRDQNLDMISHHNNFEDTIKILKNKNIISEKASKESKLPTGKQDVEIIAKTIDMVNPYEYARGMDYELGIIDVPATSGDLSEDNVFKAQKKVLANLTKNPQYYYEKLNGKVKFDGDETVEINKKSIDAIGKGKNAKIIREGIHDRDILYAPHTNIKSAPERSPEELSKDADGRSENILRMKYYNQIKDPNISDEELRYLLGGKGVKGFGGTPNAIEKIIKGRKVTNEGIFEGGFVSRGEILKALSDVGSASEIHQYLTSLEKTGDKFETVEDYVEDFKNYVADKGLDESNDPQNAIYEKYAQKMGKTIEEVKAMVAQKKKASLEEEVASLDRIYSPNERLEAKFYDDESIGLVIHPQGGKDEDKSSLISTAAVTPENFTYNFIKQTLSQVGQNVDNNEIDQFLNKVKEKINTPKEDALNEDIDLGHQDNEPHMVKADLYQIAKQASELYKIIDSVDNMGEVDFPSWWQAKITLSKNYLEGAKDYLESALATGSEDDLDESGTYAGKQSIPDAQKDPQFGSLSSTGKADALKKLQNGDTVTI
jgi:uncharacterized protein YdbL (DUF1318 family)